MSAETLRRAAALMRERAEGLVSDPAGGPWEVEAQCYCERFDDAMETGGCKHKKNYYAVRVPSRGEGISHELGEVHHGAEAEHVASWHPAVALAVAAWLDACARRYDEVVDAMPPSAVAELVAANSITGWTQATAVARAYLGADA